MCTANECITKIRENLPTIQNEYGVTGLTLFGSVARGDNTPESDVDLLVEMPPKFLVLCRLHKYLENLLNVSVDLIHRHSRMNPRFLNEVARDGITIL
ncbi:MAG: nucleotidyltransferase domain-containing protein [Muribaculaceae bacterium]|nr:nucleotidyltransferase domain-containing protein [Muribaculaceae bacterium]